MTKKQHRQVPKKSRKALWPVILPIAGLYMLLIGVACLITDICYTQRNAPTAAVAAPTESRLPTVTLYDEMSSQGFRRFIRHPHIGLTTTALPICDEDEPSSHCPANSIKQSSRIGPPLCDESNPGSKCPRTEDHGEALPE